IDDIEPSEVMSKEDLKSWIYQEINRPHGKLRLTRIGGDSSISQKVLQSSDLKIVPSYLSTVDAFNDAQARALQSILYAYFDLKQSPPKSKTHYVIYSNQFHNADRDLLFDYLQKAKDPKMDHLLPELKTFLDERVITLVDGNRALNPRE